MSGDPRQPFPDSEFDERLARLRECLVDRELDAVLLVRPENIFYVTGYRAAHIASRTSQLHSVVVPRDGSPRIFVRSLESETVKTQWTQDPVMFMDHEDPYPLVGSVLRDHGVHEGRVGVEHAHMRVRQYLRLQDELPGAELPDVTGLIEALASRPSPLEVAAMRRSAELSDLGLRVGLQSVQPGAYPYEVAARIHGAMYAAGQTDFDKSLVAVWAGPRGGLMHDTSLTNQIVDGDVVTIEIMGVDTHYRTGVQACRFVGDDPPQALREAHALVVDMHDAAKAAIRAGVRAHDVFQAANSVYREATGRDYYRRVGGSMGLTNFTLDLVKDRQQTLEPGVAIMVQTLVDDPALVTCASTVMVTDSGYDELTSPVLNLTAS